MKKKINIYIARECRAETFKIKQVWKFFYIYFLKKFNWEHVRDSLTRYHNFKYSLFQKMFYNFCFFFLKYFLKKAFLLRKKYTEKYFQTILSQKYND